MACRVAFDGRYGQSKVIVQNASISNGPAKTKVFYAISGCNAAAILYGKGLGR